MSLDQAGLAVDYESFKSLFIVLTLLFSSCVLDMRLLKQVYANHILQMKFTTSQEMWPRSHSSYVMELDSEYRSEFV